ncbi:hypothetical protein [Clostridium peptidivorans]|uniref:hypothetical protein n=1 Tax=Clostridium peptidivorans TaxID=100174 RepID=UPI000BE47B35|nr:hypothetical protein [Clostridium peptidivorans]
MKKLLNKAVLFETLISMKYIIILELLVVIIGTLMKISEVHNSIFHNFDYFRSYSSIEIVLIMMMLAAMNFLISIGVMGINKHKNFLFLSSQPITREEMIFTKGFIALSLSFINIALYMYINFIDFIANKQLYRYFIINYNNQFLIKELVLLITFSIVFFTYIFLVNGIVNNGIAAIITTIAIPLYPFAFVMLAHSLVPYRFRGFLGEILGYILGNASRYANGENIFKVTVIVSLIIIVICAVVWKLIIINIYKKIKIENMNKLFISNAVSKVINVLLCIILSLLVGNIMVAVIFIFSNIFISNPYQSIQTPRIVLLVSSAIAAPMIYKMQNKLTKLYGSN